MPEMRMHKSGGIVFVPTKEEMELQNLKDDLRKEIAEAKKLREEMLSMVRSKGGE